MEAFCQLLSFWPDCGHALKAASLDLAVEALDAGLYSPDLRDCPRHARHGSDADRLG